MKYTRFAAIIIALLLCLCAFAAIAEEAPRLDAPYFAPLSNKQLSEAAISYLGDGYKLFQPNSRETY